MQIINGEHIYNEKAYFEKLSFHFRKFDVLESFAIVDKNGDKCAAFVCDFFKDDSLNGRTVVFINGVGVAYFVRVDDCFSFENMTDFDRRLFFADFYANPWSSCFPFLISKNDFVQANSDFGLVSNLYRFKIAGFVGLAFVIGSAISFVFVDNGGVAIAKTVSLRFSEASEDNLLELSIDDLETLKEKFEVSGLVALKLKKALELDS